MSETIANKLLRIVDAKSAIHAAIVSKGLSMDGVSFEGYAEKILAIETEKNYTYGDIVLDGEITYTDATATGASATPNIPPYSQTRTDNEKTETLTEGALIQYASVTSGLEVDKNTGAVTASNLGTTQKSRTLLGYVGVFIVLNSKLYTKKVAVYQEANTYTDTWSTPVIDSFVYSPAFVDGCGGVSVTPTISASQIGKRTYTSGGTSSVSNSTFTMTFSCSSTGFSVNSTTGKVTAEKNEGDSTRVATVVVTVTGKSKKVKSTTTIEQEPAPKESYVDLGLPSGLLWAKCNIGATNPEDYGEYFQWGDIIGYSGDTSDDKSFDWSSYKWCNGSSTTLTKYNRHSSNGIVDNKATLELDDDAARQNLGDKWRMPTLDDLDELIANTRTTWITINGVQGLLFNSKINSMTLFFPFAGERKNRSIYYVGSEGYYWLSSLSSSNSYSATILGLDCEGEFWIDLSRFCGLPIRPVLEKS